MEQVKFTQDLYPSRLADQYTWMERRDPVVYRAAGPDAPLPAEDIERYRRNGYLFYERFIHGEELTALQAELQRLREDPAILSRPEAVTEPDSGDMRSIFAVHHLSPVFARIAADPRLVDIASYLLDDEVYIHQSRVNFKPGFVGKEFAWHSDFETWHTEDGLPRMRTLSMSLVLTDNTEINGALMVIPGSHLTYISCPGETPDEHYKTSLKRQQIGIPDHASLKQLAAAHGVAMPCGKAGSLLIFDCNLLHGSNSNISPFPRSNLFFVYNAMSNQPLQPFSARSPRPAFVATRQPESLNRRARVAEPVS